MIAMHKNQPSLHIKNPKKTTYNIKNVRKKICKGVDGVRKFTVKSNTNLYKRFRNKKKTRFAVHDLSKNYVNTTSHKYVAKTESQQREELHTRTMQSATPFSSSASVSMEQSINNYSLFSKETENKRSFTSDKVEFSHYICPKKSKNWLKNTTLEYIYKLSSPQRKKFQWQLLQKKQFHQNSYKTLSPKKSEVKTNEMQKSQPPLHIKNPQKKQLTASEIKNDRN